MEALSVSSVMTDCSASMVSPTRTDTSITSTSDAPPRSGTATVTEVASAVAGASGASVVSGASATRGAGVSAGVSSDESAGLLSAVLAAPASNSANASPSLTLSPTLIIKRVTVPAVSAGISMLALSVSRTISACSCSMLSPSLIRTSMTSTLLAPPRSGIFSVVICSVLSCTADQV